MNLLDRYIVRAIFAATGMVALVAGALVVLMLFISEADHIGDGHYGLSQVLAYIVLKLPARIALVLPVIALLGALTALGGLAAIRELVVIRGAGVSMVRLAVAVGLAGLVLALLAAALNAYFGPVGLRKGQALRAQARHGQIAATAGNGLWLRQGNTLLRIDTALPGGRILGLNVYHLNGDGQITEALSARRARLIGHRLVIDRPRLTRLSLQHTETAAPKRLTLNVAIDPKTLALAVTQPDELALPGLKRYIDYLQANGIDAGKYRLALWRDLVAPFTVWVLVVFALPFAFGPLRSAGAGARLFVGGLIGFVFFLINEIVASMAPVYGLPPWLAAPAPTVLLGLFTAWWLRRLN